MTPAGARRAVLDVAHRGASGYAPENTLAAVEHAIGQGASAVEVDVQRSADGELVIVHDTTLVRTTNAREVHPDRSPWEAGRFSLDELRALDAGSWFSPAYHGARVPTLRELIGVLGTGTGLMLELESPERHPGVEADLAAELATMPGYLRAALEQGRLDGAVVRPRRGAQLPRPRARGAGRVACTSTA